jgi:16S rRNA processing protein RimM
VQLVVGRVGRAHGIRGEVTVEVRTDQPERRFAPGAVLATDPAAVGPLVVTGATVHSGRLLVRFAGLAERGAAEALRGTVLLAEVDPQEAPADPEDFYDHQLVGLAVVTVDGDPLGRVAEMLHLPAQDLVVVRRPDGGELLVPFVAAIVPQVDLGAGRLVVDPPPGLLGEAPPGEA